METETIGLVLPAEMVRALERLAEQAGIPVGLFASTILMGEVIRAHAVVEKVCEIQAGLEADEATESAALN